ncbi:FixH family protein [Alteromonas sp. BMJM2]|uniref:FixH family protein n=1 Tax=Alteromonas sp. BMJM2 TaxID=2954241 RepID=UPI0022B4B4D5|nr:FixH family protein [Alteromonas sp. BMJM2]
MNTPWYKQFWPWFLIAVPVITAIMGGVLLKLAISTEDSLVVDDYYKEGKAINARLDKEAVARKLNMTSDLTIKDGSIALEFHSGIPAEGNALKLNFYHVTLEEKDVSTLLSRDANGIYRGFVETNLDGKWQISLTPIDESWKIQNTLILPNANTIKFNP